MKDAQGYHMMLRSRIDGLIAAGKMLQESEADWREIFKGDQWNKAERDLITKRAMRPNQIHNLIHTKVEQVESGIIRKTAEGIINYILSEDPEEVMG